MCSHRVLCFHVYLAPNRSMDGCLSINISFLVKRNWRVSRKNKIRNFVVVAIVFGLLLWFSRILSSSNLYLAYSIRHTIIFTTVKHQLEINLSFFLCVLSCFGESHMILELNLVFAVCGRPISTHFIHPLFFIHSFFGVCVCVCVSVVNVIIQFCKRV